ncbi:MAG: hypothetical protein SWK76_16995 [Actinomycetota bacterium]|nr:hypothetical protein [Actinomycetota bacterium]
MKEIKLEGTNKSIELSSCKAKEFSRIWQQALDYIQAASDEGCAEIAAEIVGDWAESLDPEKLTMDDVWSILLAKAGKAKAPVLAKLPELAAEAVGFLGEKGLAPVIEAMEMTITEPGEDISQE